MTSLWITSIQAQSSGPRVKIDAGTLEGSRSGDIESFKGIPYAMPPVGNLRWRAPQPVKPSKGVRRAAEFGHDCVQMSVSGDIAPTGSTRDEDCLVMNVWPSLSVADGGWWHL